MNSLREVNVLTLERIPQALQAHLHRSSVSCASDSESSQIAILSFFKASLPELRMIGIVSVLSP